MFYGSYYDNFMYFNGALWFLPCLFSMELIGYILKYTQKMATNIPSSHYYLYYWCNIN